MSTVEHRQRCCEVLWCGVTLCVCVSMRVSLEHCDNNRQQTTTMAAIVSRIVSRVFRSSGILLCVTLCFRVLFSLPPLSSSSSSYIYIFWIVVSWWWTTDYLYDLCVCMVGSWVRGGGVILYPCLSFIKSIECFLSKFQYW